MGRTNQTTLNRLIFAARCELLREDGTYPDTKRVLRKALTEEGVRQIAYAVALAVLDDPTIGVIARRTIKTKPRRRNQCVE